MSQTRFLSHWFAAVVLISISIALGYDVYSSGGFTSKFLPSELHFMMWYVLLNAQSFINQRFRNGLKVFICLVMFDFRLVLDCDPQLFFMTALLLLLSRHLMHMGQRGSI
jgi:hypothetical protein